MPILFPIFFLFWKLVKRTKWETALSADITSFVDDPEVGPRVFLVKLKMPELTQLTSQLQFTEIHHYEDEENRGAVGAFSHKLLSTLF